MACNPPARRPIPVLAKQPGVTRDNFILGMAILGIGGTFGIIAYSYSTLGLGSPK